MIAATSGEDGRKALMREIGLGKALADSPLPNVVEFIGCVTTQSKEPFCFCFYALFLKIYSQFSLPRSQVWPKWIIPRFLRTNNNY